MSLAQGKKNLKNLNTSKTEIIIYRPRKKQITTHLNFRISDQRMNTCINVKYLGITLEENLEWNLDLNLIKSKLNRAIGLLYKFRHYLSKFVLETLCYTIFHSHLKFACQI